MGKSRPGNFLKTTAYLSAATIPISVADEYVQRRLNRLAFKMEKIEPAPSKLWERTKHWTVEDVIINGGILGMFLALQPRALPGVYGWKRFLGAATVGGALGGYAGQVYLGRLPSHHLDLVDQLDAQTQKLYYMKLLHSQTKDSLSRLDQALLTFYSWPSLRHAWNPLAPPHVSRQEDIFQQATSSIGHESDEDDHDEEPSQPDIVQQTIIQLEFSKGELSGPDIEHGYRAYKDKFSERDAHALQAWLDGLKDVGEKSAREAQYMWEYLAMKEHEFYKLADDDSEKDTLRRQIQLLNNLAAHFTLRASIYAYHIADGRKRLQQVEDNNNTPTDQGLVFPTELRPVDLPENWKDSFAPHLVTEQVRVNWIRQKQLVGFLEQSIEAHEEAGKSEDQNIKHLRKNLEEMRKNVRGTERLLKDLEERVHKADERTGI